MEPVQVKLRKARDSARYAEMQKVTQLLHGHCPDRCANEGNPSVFVNHKLMVPDWRNGAPLALDGEAFPVPEHSAQPRPTTGSRKRKAYMPRNSGCDEAAGSSSQEQQQLNGKKRATGTKAARPTPRKPTEACGPPAHTTAGPVAGPMIRTAAQSTDSHPSSPAAGSSKAHSMSPRSVAVDAQRCGSGSSSAAAAPATTASQAVGVAVESLATTRSRRVIKRREKFDPHMFELSGDLDEAEESRSDNSSEMLSRRSCYRKIASGVLPCIHLPPFLHCALSRLLTQPIALPVLLHQDDASGMFMARQQKLAVYLQMGERL